VNLDPSDPRLKSVVKSAIWIAVVVPLLFFVMLDLSLDEDTERCGEGRRNIIAHRGVEHCVSDFWAFVDALIVPWLTLVFALILIANLVPRVNKWLNDNER